jgi:hypothetical protein
MRIGIVLILLILNVLASAQSLVFPPRHDEEKDPALKQFTDRLKDAVARRDVAFIRQSLDDQAVSALDSEGSAAAFMANWHVADTSAEFWTDIDRVLRMGGTFISGQPVEKYQFVFPYPYEVDLDEEADYFNVGVITGKNVNLRAAPDTKAAVVTQLTYHVVNFITDEEGYRIVSGGKSAFDPDWYKVVTADHASTGWVSARYVYDIMGPRLVLYKTAAGAWKISCFAVGD